MLTTQVSYNPSRIARIEYTEDDKGGCELSVPGSWLLQYLWQCRVGDTYVRHQPLIRVDVYG